MEREGIGFDDLRDDARRSWRKRVHVVGDTIVDSYTHCAMIGGQTKTPTMSVLFEHKLDYIGGAGDRCQALSRGRRRGDVLDGARQRQPQRLRARRTCNDAGVDVDAVIDKTRPTTNKNAIVVGGYRLLKVDTLDNSSISDDDARPDDATRCATVPADAVVYSRFPPRHLQPAHDPARDRRHSRGMSTRSPTARWRAAGAISPSSRASISSRRTSARRALRSADQDSGVRPLARSSMTRRAVQDADPQARRSRRAHLP